MIITLALLLPAAAAAAAADCRFTILMYCLFSFFVRSDLIRFFGFFSRELYNAGETWWIEMWIFPASTYIFYPMRSLPVLFVCDQGWMSANKWYTAKIHAWPPCSSWYGHECEYFVASFAMHTLLICCGTTYCAIRLYLYLIFIASC